MTTAIPSVSRYVGPVLIGLGGVLAAANWYLDPARALNWLAALVFLACLALVFRFAVRRSPAPAAPGQSADSIRNAIAFASSIIVVSLGARLVDASGAVDDPDLSQRLTMVTLGAFFVFTGNAMPKMLTPLSVMRCNGARAQAVQRFMGWAFVLAGLGFAIVWLVLPPDIAEPLSVTFVIGAGLAVMARAIHVRRVSHSG